MGFSGFEISIAKISRPVGPIDCTRRVCHCRIPVPPKSTNASMMDGDESTRALFELSMGSWLAGRNAQSSVPALGTPVGEGVFDEAPANCAAQLVGKFVPPM